MVDRIESESFVVSAQLNQWPHDMFARTQLRSVVLMRNALSAADEQLTTLTMLETLNLKYNQFNNLDVIVDCASLLSLDLCFNRLDALPTDIGARLPHLQSLKLDGNKLFGAESIVPLCGISTLTHLTLQQNALHALPQPQIGRLSRLQLLDLRNTALRELPDALFDLVDLRFLRLQRNSLRRLPPRIGALSRLHSLSLDQNELYALPCTLVHIVDLNFLSFDSNRLDALPTAIGELPAVFLDFASNPYVNDEEIRSVATLRVLPQRRSEAALKLLRARFRVCLRHSATLLRYARLLLTTPLVRHFVRGRGDLVVLPPHVLRDVLNWLVDPSAAIDEQTNNSIVEFATVRPIVPMDETEFARRVLFTMERGEREAVELARALSTGDDDADSDNDNVDDTGSDAKF